MSNTIYKYGEDQFVVWNDTAHNSEIWGSAFVVERYLTETSSCKRCGGDEAIERVNRARRTGTSSLVYSMPTHKIYKQLGLLRMSDMALFLDVDEDGEPLIALLEPFEDDDE